MSADSSPEEKGLYEGSVVSVYDKVRNSVWKQKEGGVWAQNTNNGLII